MSNKEEGVQLLLMCSVAAVRRSNRTRDNARCARLSGAMGMSGMKSKSLAGVVETSAEVPVMCRDDAQTLLYCSVAFRKHEATGGITMARCALAGLLTFIRPEEIVACVPDMQGESTEMLLSSSCAFCRDKGSGVISRSRGVQGVLGMSVKVLDTLYIDAKMSGDGGREVSTYSAAECKSVVVCNVG